MSKVQSWGPERRDRSTTEKRDVMAVRRSEPSEQLLVRVQLDVSGLNALLLGLGLPFCLPSSPALI